MSASAVVLFLLLNLYAQLGHVQCAVDPYPGKKVCGLGLTGMISSVKTWIKAAESCPVHKLCETKNHIMQYQQARIRCTILAKKQPPPPPAVVVQRELLPKIETAMTSLQAMFEPTKADLTKLDKVLDQQLRDAWNELAALQTEVFHSTITSGRIERAMFYSILEDGNNPQPDVQPTNVQELLKYAWALPFRTSQRNMYKLIEKVVREAHDPLLETLYTVDVANVANPVLGSQEQLFNDHLERLRRNLTANSYDTLVSIARRFPDRFAYLNERLLKLPEGTKPQPDTLPSVVNFIGQLPTAQQRFKAVEVLLQSLTVENGTLASDAEYVYPLAKLANGLGSLMDSKKYTGADEVRDKFNTPVSGKSAQYFKQLLVSPSSKVVA
ncbi:uncharacterized protein LOC126565861 [Anopheles maculipalpis]|uniref:uncharacterized protein LOC126565861 n=1 Tax=Anopheles maculipalpis TaxID=1496333 RepID=UPI0021596A72|nr:uncharacterized protein LOC126565861 [Anopheles maculipalpis]